MTHLEMEQLQAKHPRVHARLFQPGNRPLVEIENGRLNFLIGEWQVYTEKAYMVVHPALTKVHIPARGIPTLIVQLA